MFGAQPDREWPDRQLHACRVRVAKAAAFHAKSGAISPAASMNASVSVATATSSSSAAIPRCDGERGKELALSRDAIAIGDRLPQETRGFGQKVNVAGSGIENDGIGRIVIAGPHEIGGHPPWPSRTSAGGQLWQTPDSWPSESARTRVRPFTVAKYHGQARERGTAQERSPLVVRNGLRAFQSRREYRASGRNLSAIKDARDDSMLDAALNRNAFAINHLSFAGVGRCTPATVRKSGFRPRSQQTSSHARHRANGRRTRTRRIERSPIRRLLVRQTRSLPTRLARIRFESGARAGRNLAL